MAYRLTPEHVAEHRASRHEARTARRRRAARRTAAALPTLFTLGNLLCGFASIFMASRDPGDPASHLPWHWTPLTFSAVFIFLGMAMDGLDGRIARLTHSTSDLGEQLDSMADMVTFGVAPAFMAVQLVGVGVPFVGEALEGIEGMFNRVALVTACIYVACAALRLARFNIEVAKPAESDHMSFKGLPSPGAAGTVASLVLLHQHFVYKNIQSPLGGGEWSKTLSAYGMVAIMLLAAFAMVSRLRYVHVVNRYLRGRVPFRRVAMVVVIGLLMIVNLQGSLAAVFALYALSAPTVWLWARVTGKPLATSHVVATAPPAAASTPPADKPTDAAPRDRAIG
ncbi:MAG: CDP-alcohol phosphatidyltransferase family protein [Planctomycetes bacterium]|nr:CDP-alcohol phosphatidyltransferase family protein [Planctomycetota bacterium]